MRKLLIIGGGIAGITASLEAADSDIHVFLVEAEPSLGGKMIKLDKTFPTLDCSSCILTPKMSEVYMHENIRLLSYSEIEEIKRVGKGFRVKIKKKPRFVKEERCIACGLCTSACVMKRAKDEFNEHLSERSAIYIPFPQAVPQKYLIDKESCLFLSKGRCKRSCLSQCPTSAIDFEMKEEVVEEEFDGILISTGFDLYIPTQKKEFGYGTVDRVFTSLEFERILSATGPTKGEIVFEEKVPKRFFFVQCVGSRDRQLNAPFCSRVCCMYTAKQGLIIKERIKDAEVFISYIDVRAYGKGYEEFVETAQNMGILYIRGLPEIRRGKEGPVIRVEDMLGLEIMEMEVDAVILACGIRPSKKALRLIDMLGIERDDYGFIKTSSLFPSLTNVEGVFACGVSSGPKDIPDTVSSALEAVASFMEYIKR